MKLKQGPIGKIKSVKDTFGNTKKKIIGTSRHGIPMELDYPLRVY